MGRVIELEYSAPRDKMPDVPNMLLIEAVDGFIFIGSYDYQNNVFVDESGQYVLDPLMVKYWAYLLTPDNAPEVPSDEDILNMLLERREEL